MMYSLIKNRYKSCHVVVTLLKGANMYHLVIDMCTLGTNEYF